MLENSAMLWENCELHMIATKKDLGSYADNLKKAGYIIHHIYDKNRLNHHRKIRELLACISPDVVHIHCEAQDYLYAFDARCLKVKRIVRTVHSVFRFTGILRIRRIITRFVSRVLGVRFISIGRSVDENESKRFFNRPYQLINNWIDEEKFKFISEDEKRIERGKMGISEEEFVILTVGSCQDVKNHVLLINVFYAFVKKNGKKNIRYIHVGQGELEQDEKDLAQKLGLLDNIIFVGYDDPVKYLSVADVYVMPSKYEGFGISALEAMRTGIPCLLSDVVGLRDFRCLNSNSIVYSDLNEKSILEQLDMLYCRFNKDELKRDKMLSEEVSCMYNMKKSVTNYLSVYN